MSKQDAVRVSNSIQRDSAELINQSPDFLLIDTSFRRTFQKQATMTQSMESVVLFIQQGKLEESKQAPQTTRPYHTRPSTIRNQKSLEIRESMKGHSSSDNWKSNLRVESDVLRKTSSRYPELKGSNVSVAPSGNFGKVDASHDDISIEHSRYKDSVFEGYCDRDKSEN